MSTPSREATGAWTIEDLVSLGVPRTYRVRHTRLGTTALMKVTPWSKHTADGQAREIGALRRIRHPGLSEVLDSSVDREADLLWTAFAWFDGESLLDRLQSGALPWREACRIFREVGETLAEVHNAGLVHRDLRPSNILVAANDSTRLVGFDFAMTQQELDQLSEAPFGDLGYLAPEVLRDPGHHGAKADTYALGCVLYEMLTGQAPFPAAAWGARPDGAARMLEWKARSSALDPGPACPDWLRSLVGKATHPDPDRRLPDLGAWVGWLDAARPSWQPVEAAPREVVRETLPIVLVPSLPLPAPSLRLHTPTPATVLDRPAPPAPVVPSPALYFAAATLGALCALGFSSILILFVEMRDGLL